MNYNYPAGSHHYTGGNSPFADDDGLEDAHTAKCEEIEEDVNLIAEIISELSGEKYTELTTAVYKSLSGLGYLMAVELHDEATDAYQLLLASQWQDLPVEAHLIIEEAISEYAMSEILN